MAKNTLRFLEHYGQFLKTIKKYGGNHSDGIGIFLNCLHFAWDETMDSSGLIRPLINIIQKKELKDANTFAQEFHDFSTSVIQWLHELEKKEEFEADAHVDNTLEMFIKVHGQDFWSVFLKAVTNEFEIMLDTAHVSLPAPTEDNFDEVSLKKIKHSRLEPAWGILMGVPRCIAKINNPEMGIKSEIEDWYKELFDQYMFSCEFLDAFRRQRHIYEQKYRKIGPNEQCPCESGRKWKFCHGK
jgi:hypothetical protein